MACIVGIIFVDESQNFGFEKSGKSFNRRKGKWSWRYKAESDESVDKSTENRDATVVTTIYTAAQKQSLWEGRLRVLFGLCQIKHPSWRVTGQGHLLLNSFLGRYPSFVSKS